MTSSRPQNLLKAIRAGEVLIATGTGEMRSWRLSGGTPIEPAAATTLLAVPFLGGRLQPCCDALPGFGADCSQSWRWQADPKRPRRSRQSGATAPRSIHRLRMGPDQLQALAEMVRLHGTWCFGCGWHIGGLYRTTRIMESLERRGLVRRETADPRPAEVWGITEAGRAAVVLPTPAKPPIGAGALTYAR